MELVAAFQQHIKEEYLFESTDRLLLAISGGRDSVVLLDLLLNVGFRPALIHCNFQLRGPASDADEAFVKELAANYSLSCYTRSFATKHAVASSGASVQMVARELRYDYFEEVRAREGYDYIVTAHHLDDSIETMLLNFLRGTGLNGMQGIAAKTATIRRPLLFTNSQALADYQEQWQLPFREDESNASDAYRRNYLRHHVLPHLYVLQPSLGKIARQNFTHFTQGNALLQAHLASLKDTYTKEEEGQLLIDRRALAAHPQASTLLWEWLSPLGFRAEQLRQMLVVDTAKLASNDWVAAITDASIVVYPAQSISTTSQSWDEGEALLQLDNGRQLSQEELRQWETWPNDSNIAWVDLATLVFPLSIRYWQAGDYFCPLGMKGQRQKLQDFFVNQKIDQVQRARTPLLVNGNGEIIWIVGHRLDERYKVQSTTKRVLALSYS